MRRKAFTWWQTLIGLVVIAGLAFAFWPVSTSRGVGENPWRSACQTNLKQIGLALKQYTQDYNEAHPFVQSGKQSWVSVIQPYLKDERPFQCPAEPAGKMEGTTDYFYNARLAGRREREFNFMSNTIMGGDGIGNSPINASLSQLPQSWFGDSKSPARRHLEGANYLYADGHVKWLKPDKVTDAKADSSVSTFSVD